MGEVKPIRPEQSWGKEFLAEPTASGMAAAALGRRMARDGVATPVPARIADMVAVYAAFPARWQSFLHSQFRSPAEVAVFFGVTEKGASKWWEGVGGVRGEKIALAVIRRPEAAAMLFAAE